MIEKRTGELCPKAIIQNALNELLDTRHSITDFAQQLMAQNIRPIPNIASAGKMNGFHSYIGGLLSKLRSSVRVILGQRCRTNSTINRNVIMLSCLN